MQKGKLAHRMPKDTQLAGAGLNPLPELVMAEFQSHFLLPKTLQDIQSIAIWSLLIFLDKPHSVILILISTHTAPTFYLNSRSIFFR